MKRKPMPAVLDMVVTRARAVVSKPKVTQVEMTIVLTVEDPKDGCLAEEQKWNAAAQWITLLQHANGWEFSSLHWTSYNTVKLVFSPWT